MKKNSGRKERRRDLKKSGFFKRPHVKGGLVQHNTIPNWEYVK